MVGWREAAEERGRAGRGERERERLTAGLDMGIKSWPGGILHPRAPDSRAVITARPLPAALDNTGAELVAASDVNWRGSRMIMSSQIHVGVADGTPP